MARDSHLKYAEFLFNQTEASALHDEETGVSHSRAGSHMASRITIVRYRACRGRRGCGGQCAGKVAMCIGCHGIEGYRAAFPGVYRVPMIGGQNAKYIEIALHDYKKGNRKYATMRAIATSLSDQDIADIAAYYAAQAPSSRNNPDK